MTDQIVPRRKPASTTNALMLALLLMHAVPTAIVLPSITVSVWVFFKIIIVKIVKSFDIIFNHFKK